jgi:hypothetical protein
VCYPLTELSVIRHEPDNRFLECALAADAEFIVTVNTAPGHFDRKQYQTVSVARPGEFLNVPGDGLHRLLGVVLSHSRRINVREAFRVQLDLP